MLVEEGHPGECLPAGLAAVLLDFGVGLEMCAEVGPVGERSLAVRAREGLLAGMSANVALKQPRSGESLPAELALARQGMCPDVHFESPKGHVFLVAVFAVEGFLVLCVAVQLPVLAQPAERRVLLPAVGAVVLGAVFAILVAASFFDLLLGFRRCGSGRRRRCGRRRLKMLLAVVRMRVVVVMVVMRVLVRRQRGDHAVLVVNNRRRGEEMMQRRLWKVGVEWLGERWRRAVPLVDVREGVGFER